MTSFYWSYISQGYVMYFYVSMKITGAWCQRRRSMVCASWLLRLYDCEDLVGSEPSTMCRIVASSSSQWSLVRTFFIRLILVRNSFKTTHVLGRNRCGNCRLAWPCKWLAWFAHVFLRRLHLCFGFGFGFRYGFGIVFVFVLLLFLLL